MADWSLKQLVEIFATNTPATLGNSPVYIDLCRRYGENSTFKTQRARVEEAAEIVRETMESAGGTAEEVIKGLRLMRRARPVLDDVELYHDLISTGYSARWTDAERAHFERASASLMLREDFFFSFTNRYEVPYGENPANSSYKRLILEVLSPEEWTAADRKAANLLARTIYILVCRSGRKKLSGFFFPDNQFDNDYTEDKLKRELQQSFVFLQFVQNIMLHPPVQGKKNYCHWEFSVVCEWLSSDRDRRNRILFAVGENSRNDLISSDEVYPSYGKWHRQIIDRDPPYFPEPAGDAETCRKQVETLVRDKLVQKIEQAWDAEIEGIAQTASR